MAGGPVPPGAQPQQPSEEELRQYLGEMRQGHVGEIVAQVVSALLNGAQVKLGRRDARLLIDMAGAVNDLAEPHLDNEFTGEVTQVLSQLRMAQVEAEDELNKLRASGQAPAETNDLGSAGDAGATPTSDGTASAPPASGPGGAAAPRPKPQQPPVPPQQGGSRLWTPGS
jgi:hypothetical protein